MRNLQEKVLAAVANTGTKTSDAIDASYLVCASVQAKFSTTDAAGSLTLQGSNDLPGATAPATWSDIPNTAQTVTAGDTTALIPRTEICYRWIRVVWVSSAGTGTVTAILQAQGF